MEKRRVILFQLISALFHLALFLISFNLPLFVKESYEVPTPVQLIELPSFSEKGKAKAEKKIHVKKPEHLYAKTLPRMKEPSKPAKVPKPIKTPPKTKIEPIDVVKELEKPSQLQPKLSPKPKMLAKFKRKSSDTFKAIEERLRVARRTKELLPDLSILPEGKEKIDVKDVPFSPSVKPKVLAQVKKRATFPKTEISKVINPRRQRIISSEILPEDILTAEEGITEIKEAIPVGAASETKKLKSMVASVKPSGPSRPVEALAKNLSMRHNKASGLEEDLLRQAKGELSGVRVTPPPLSYEKKPKSLGGKEMIREIAQAPSEQRLKNILAQPGQRKGVNKRIDEGIKIAEVLSEKAAFHSPASPVSIAKTPIKTPGKGPLIEGEKVIPLNSNDPNLGPYLQHIRERILKVWRYPKNAQPGLHGKVALLFTVERDGSVSKMKIMSSSGYLVLDEGVLEAMKRAVPFYPIPPNIKLKHLPILGNFMYN